VRARSTRSGRAPASQLRGGSPKAPVGETQPKQSAARTQRSLLGASRLTSNSGQRTEAWPEAGVGLGGQWRGQPRGNRQGLTVWARSRLGRSAAPRVGQAAQTQFDRHPGTPATHSPFPSTSTHRHPNLTEPTRARTTHPPHARRRPPGSSVNWRALRSRAPHRPTTRPQNTLGEVHLLSCPSQPAEPSDFLGTMNFFKKSNKSPAELVRDVRYTIAKLDSPTIGSDGKRKVSDKTRIQAWVKLN